MQFDPWITDAWNRHADAPDAVLTELADTGAALAADDGAVGRLLHLAQHIAGAHQGGPAELAAGRGLLQTLAALPAAGPAARASAALYDRALALTGGDSDATAGLAPSDAIRATALAASNLADREPARAGGLLQPAVAAAGAAALPDADPAVRALAVAGNQIAAALEELPLRDEATCAWMLQAAHIGLVHWRRAGTWLEEERAHYRLAVCAATAGDAAVALEHARACLAIVQREGGEALEVFFGQEALARAHAAAGDAAARVQAVQDAAEAFQRLSPDDQPWCRETLQRLRGLAV